MPVPLGAGMSLTWTLPHLPCTWGGKQHVVKPVASQHIARATRLHRACNQVTGNNRVSCAKDETMT